MIRMEANRFMDPVLLARKGEDVRSRTGFLTRGSARPPSLPIPNVGTVAPSERMGRRSPLTVARPCRLWRTSSASLVRGDGHYAIVVALTPFSRRVPLKRGEPITVPFVGLRQGEVCARPYR